MVQNIQEFSASILIAFTLLGAWWALSEPSGSAFEVIGRVVVGVVFGFIAGVVILLLLGVLALMLT